MKIGLLGGSFNPIHNAHLEIAEQARLACALERVVFIPAADPPHKKLAGDVPFGLRCRMVELAIAARPGYELSTIEGERSGKSYSIDTIQAFRVIAPQDELFFIIGGDSFLEIGLWHRYADIFSSCSLIVLERPGHEIGDPLKALPDAVRMAFCFEGETRRLIHSSGHLVCFVQGAPRNVSSTEIRRLAADGKSITHLVPPDVAAYISQQRIYSE
ncbi:MAG: nicotinate (nicotinamide) nucleotide adenylyltransferase [Deltaproteobacteria bacterium]|nr:nicotinate (nicotinamide) nucleotide adenylyltransferase [Deltaproteobacteria bacterium]